MSIPGTKVVKQVIVSEEVTGLARKHLCVYTKCIVSKKVSLGGHDIPSPHCKCSHASCGLDTGEGTPLLLSWKCSKVPPTLDREVCEEGTRQNDVG